MRFLTLSLTDSKPDRNGQIEGSFGFAQSVPDPRFSRPKEGFRAPLLDDSIVSLRGFRNRLGHAHHRCYRQPRSGAVIEVLPLRSTDFRWDG